jgi:hypothetical protein
VAQINLLKQSAPSNNLWEIIPKILTRVFAVVLIGLILYYAWLFFRSKSLDNQIAATKVQINTDRQSALNSPQRDELLVRQTQLKDLSGLISSHVYFSQLLPVLAQDTLKTASYSSLKADASGNLTLAVTVPTLEDLDKYLQVFDLPEVNKNFSNVRIGGYTKVNIAGSTAISFQVNMQYNPSIIGYNASSASASGQ